MWGSELTAVQTQCSACRMGWTDGSDVFQRCVCCVLCVCCVCCHGLCCCVAAGLPCAGLLSSADSSPSSSSAAGCFTNPSYRTLGPCTYVHYTKPDKRNFYKVSLSSKCRISHWWWNPGFKKSQMILKLRFKNIINVQLSLFLCFKLPVFKHSNKLMSDSFLIIIY